MKWSKLKKEIELRLADKLQGRLAFFTTTYANSSVGRSWVTFDKTQIANFETILSYKNYGAYYNIATDTDCSKHDIIDNTKRTPELPMERGEFSQFDFMTACWDYLQLNIDEALESENPIIKSIAMVDKRLGKRRLAEINISGLHPLTKLFLNIRLNVESISTKSQTIK